MTDTTHNNTAPAFVNLFATGIFDNVLAIATALKTGKLEVIAPTDTIDGDDAIAQWGKLDSVLDTMGTDFSKNVRNAGMILYVTWCAEDGDVKVTREAIAKMVNSRPEFVAANPDPAEPSQAAKHAFTRGFALAMLTEYGNKSQRREYSDTPSLTLLGAASRWSKSEVDKKALVAACDSVKEHAAKTSAGRSASGADKGRPVAEKELSEKLGQVTAENAQHAAANAGLVKAVERVEQTAAMHLATMADVVATLENATLSDTVARAKALEDLRAAVAQAS